MSEYLSPGVRLFEKDESQYATSNNNTGVGIVGGAVKGPLELTQVTSQRQFINLFGPPSLLDFGGQAAMAVLNYTDRLIYKRILYEGTPAKGTANGLTISSLEMNESLNGWTLHIKDVDPDNPTGDTFTAYLHDASDVEIEVYSSNVTFVPTDDNFIQKIIQLESSYIQCDYSPQTIVAGEVDITLDHGEAGATKCSGTGKGSNTNTPSFEDMISFTSLSYDSTLNGCKIVLSAQDSEKYFTYSLLKGDTVLESFSYMTFDPEVDPNREFARYLQTFSKFVTCYVGANYAVYAVSGDNIALSGGSDGLDRITKEAVVEALEAFRDVEQSDINVLLAPGWFDKDVVRAGISVCDANQGGRGNAFFIADPPFGFSSAMASDWADGTGLFLNEFKLDNSYCGYFHDWGVVSDQTSGYDLWLPPSGEIATLVCYNDKTFSPWSALAGVKYGIIQRYKKLGTSPSKTVRDMIQGGRSIVNPIIFDKAYGFMALGQKTTQRKPTALDRLNVRRLLNYLKTQVLAVSRRFLFEPNDPYTWAQWRDAITTIMEAVKAGRGVSDYEIIMDKTTVSVEDIENNRMPGIIRFKPVKTAEYIDITFVITNQGVIFDAAA